LLAHFFAADAWLEDTGAAGEEEEEEDWEAVAEDAEGDEGAVDEAWVAEARALSGEQEEDAKEALDPTRAKHVAKAKMRALEEERAADAATAAAFGTPLDDPVAEKARIRAMEEAREVAIAQEAFAGGAGEDAAASPAAAAPAPGAVAAPALAAASPAPALAAASGAGAEPSAEAPKTVMEWVDMVPIKGPRAWSEAGGMLVDKSMADKSKLAPSNFVRGVLRAAVTEEVLSKQDVDALMVMLKDAEANLAIAGEKQAQGRSKKKKGNKGRNLASKRGQGKAGYTSVRSDADIMGSMAGGSASAAAGMSDMGGDDDDFM